MRTTFFSDTYAQVVSDGSTLFFRCIEQMLLLFRAFIDFMVRLWGGVADFFCELYHWIFPLPYLEAELYLLSDTSPEIIRFDPADISSSLLTTPPVDLGDLVRISPINVGLLVERSFIPPSDTSSEIVGFDPNVGLFLDRSFTPPTRTFFLNTNVSSRLPIIPADLDHSDTLGL